MHTAKCKFYTERIALASSSKELHQIVNTLSNRHPPKILPTIYHNANLPSIFIKHFTKKVEKLTAKCKFYTERIALASSSKELHQIVNTLSNRHPPKILPTIYPNANLPSIFIKHFTNKVEILRANIASEPVTLVTGTTSAPKSCEIDPISSKLLIECLDSVLPSLTDLFNSSLVSGIFQQCFKSALVTPILKKRCLDHNDGGGGVDPIPCVSTHRISDPRSGPAQLLPPHVKQRSHPHGVRPQIPDR